MTRREPRPSTFLRYPPHRHDNLPPPREDPYHVPAPFSWRELAAESLWALPAAVVVCAAIAAFWILLVTMGPGQ